MSWYYHKACCGWMYFDQRPVTGMSQFVWFGGPDQKLC